MKSIKSVQYGGMACGIWTSKCEKGALQTFILQNKWATRQGRA